MFPSIIYKRICNKQKGYQQRDLKTISYKLYSSAYIQKVYANDFESNTQYPEMLSLIWVGNTQPSPFYGVYFTSDKNFITQIGTYRNFNFDMVFDTDMKNIWWFAIMNAYGPCPSFINNTNIIYKTYCSNSLRSILIKQPIMSHTIVERNDYCQDAYSRTIYPCNKTTQRSY